MSIIARRVPVSAQNSDADMLHRTVLNGYPLSLLTLLGCRRECLFLFIYINIIIVTGPFRNNHSRWTILSQSFFLLGILVGVNRFYRGYIWDLMISLKQSLLCFTVCMFIKFEIFIYPYTSSCIEFTKGISKWISSQHSSQIFVRPQGFPIRLAISKANFAISPHKYLWNNLITCNKVSTANTNIRTILHLIYINVIQF